jgi:hypothetical protein
MKTMFALIILFFIVTGCSTSFVVSSSSEDTSADEFNNFVQGQVAEIILRDTIVNNATDVYLSVDSLHWNNSEDMFKSSVVKSDVSKVIISNKFIGGLEGLAFGIPSGVISALIIAVALGGGEGGVIILSGFGVIVGALAGITTGVIIGHSYVFIISDY